MINYTFSRVDSAVYPGQYTPIPHPDWNDCKKQEADLPFEVHETPNGYRVTIALPGFNKEDLLIHVDPKSVEIILIYKRDAVLSDQTDQTATGNLHETRVPLPQDADLEFITGEYNNGKLLLEIPRCDASVSQGVKEIVIY